MDFILFHLKRLLTIFRNEVLVLPSRVSVLVFVLALLLLPLLSSDSFFLRVMVLTSIFAIFAASWDLLSGFTGQMNFGHALFFGVGAYGAALLNLHAHIPPWGSIPLGALIAVVAGLIVGIPSLRLRGTYLALTTLAFPIVVLMGVVFTFPDFTGGELGVSGIARLAPTRVGDYYISVLLMLGLCFLMWKITDSNTGIIFHAIREDEIAVRAAGINTTRYKLLAFSLSGFFAGIAGGLYAHFMRIAGPSTLEVSLSFTVVIWSIFGGVVTIYGAIGAVFVLFLLIQQYLQPILRSLLESLLSLTMPVWMHFLLKLLYVVLESQILVLAIVVLMVLLFMPDGLFPWLRDKIEKECPRCKVRNIATRHTCRICTASLD